MCNTSAVRSVVQNLVSCSSSHALRCATTFLSLTSAIGIADIVTIITITNITISITILTTSKMNIRCLCDINDPSLSVLKLLEVARDLTAGNFLIEKLPNCPPPPHRHLNFDRDAQLWVLALMCISCRGFSLIQNDSSGGRRYFLITKLLNTAP